jgi:hypothetical protein
MMCGMAALGCNKQNSYLGMTHAEGVSSASASSALILPVQLVTDEDSVESDEGERRAVAYIAKEASKICEKESRIATANGEKSRKEASRDTLRQQSETRRSSVQEKRKDTQDIEEEIDKSKQQGDSFSVYCETCKKQVECTKPALIKLVDKYKPGYSHIVETEYNYSIFLGSSYSRTIYNRRFEKCFRCSNQEGIEQLLEQIKEHENRIKSIEDQIAEDDRALASLNNEKQEAEERLRECQSQYRARIRLRREREESNRKQAEIAKERDEAHRRIAYLESQLAARDQRAGYESASEGACAGRLLYAAVRAGAEAEVALDMSRVEGFASTNENGATTGGENNFNIHRFKLTRGLGDLDTNMPAIEPQTPIETIIQPTTRTEHLLRHEATSSESERERGARIERLHIAYDLMRNHASIELICSATRFTPEELESLRREGLPQEIIAPSGGREDDLTTLTGQMDANTQFTAVLSIDSQALEEAEGVAFGDRGVESERETTTESKELGSITILPSVAGEALETDEI